MARTKLPEITRTPTGAVIVARSAVEADATAEELFPAGFTVTLTTTTTRGGVNGFFSTELVELHVQDAAHAAAAAPVADSGVGEDGNLTPVDVDALLSKVGTGSVPFAAQLVEEIHQQRPAHLPHPAPAAVPARAAAPVPAPASQAQVRDTQVAQVSQLQAAQAPVPQAPTVRPEAPRLVTSPPVVTPGPQLGTSAAPPPAPVVPAPATTPAAPVASAGPAPIEPARPTAAQLPESTYAHSISRDGDDPTVAAVSRTVTSLHGRAEVLSEEPGYRWTRPSLIALGFPGELLDRPATMPTSVDAAWTTALICWLDGLCGPQPEGATVFAGPGADQIAARLGLPVIEVEQLAATGGSVAVTSIDAAAVARGLAGRNLHVVVGGHGWQAMTALPISAVSASGPGKVIETIRAAAGWGVPIGWIVGRERVVRAGAVDLSLAVRAQMPAV